MATLRQYYETNFPYTMRVVGWLSCDGEEVECTVHYDFNGLTCFLSCIVPETARTFNFFQALIKEIIWGSTRIKLAGKVILPAAMVSPCLKLKIENSDELPIAGNFTGDPEWFSTKDMAATRRVFLYTETNLSDEEASLLKRAAKERGIDLQVLAETYRSAREASEIPLALICHDSRDKDAVARKIAMSLQSMLCPVWYDEFRLKVGDPLRESIETGLKQCKKCILVLSENFLSNNGWTKTEFNSIFTREIIEEKRLVLPVWFGVTKKQVFDYSPSLADVVAVRWDPENAESACKDLHKAIVS